MWIAPATAHGHSTDLPVRIIRLLVMNSLTHWHLHLPAIGQLQPSTDLLTTLGSLLKFSVACR